MPRLNVIVASTRPVRVGEQVAAWFVAQAKAHGGFQVEVVDLAELNLPFLDEPESAVEAKPYRQEHTRWWSALTDAADAFVFVMPEYNQGYTAPLKNALDYLYHEWLYKPVGFVSYGMTSGGLRAVHTIKPVVAALKMMPVYESVVIHLRQALGPDGLLVPTAQMEAHAREMLDELVRMSALFAPVRVRRITDQDR
jgi:NAD(P)H-dependent FMN reductase